jgi:hypothetical protein
MRPLFLLIVVWGTITSPLDEEEEKGREESQFERKLKDSQFMR